MGIMDGIKELKKCRDDVLYFTTNYVNKIVTLDRGEELHPHQIKALELLKCHRFFIGCWCRQSRKSTTLECYGLHYAIFNEGKNIGLTSHNITSAKRILDNIKRMYEGLPIWLKPGVTESTKTSIAFDNGSKIIISATTAHAFIGIHIDMLLMDEFAFVPKQNGEEFWTLNYPIISSSQTSRIVILSTQNDKFPLFRKLWMDAIENKNSFVTQKVSWEQIPGMEEWAKEQIKILGMKEFNQQYASEFNII